MTDNVTTDPVPVFSFSNILKNWKKETCGTCAFFVEVPGQQVKANQPVVKECRESPPSLFAMPGMNALRQPELRIAAQYPRLDPQWPACSKWSKHFEATN